MKKETPCAKETHFEKDTHFEKVTHFEKETPFEKKTLEKEHGFNNNFTFYCTHNQLSVPQYKINVYST